MRPPGGGLLGAFDALESHQIDAPRGARDSLGGRQRFVLGEHRPRLVLGEHVDKTVGFTCGREPDPRLVCFELLEVADRPPVGVKDTADEHLAEDLGAPALELDELQYLRREPERGRLSVALGSPTEAFGQLAGRGQRPLPVHPDVKRDDGKGERKVDEREDCHRDTNHNRGNPETGRLNMGAPPCRKMCRSYFL